MPRHSSSLCPHMRLHVSALAALALGLAGAHPCTVKDIDKPGRPYAALRGCTVLNLGREPDGADKRMGDSGAFALARALASEEGRGVSHVSLYGQGIGPAGAAELAEMLKTRACLSQPQHSPCAAHPCRVV